jgi:hypothetical protein
VFAGADRRVSDLSGRYRTGAPHAPRNVFRRLPSVKLFDHQLFDHQRVHNGKAFLPGGMGIRLLFCALGRALRSESQLQQRTRT